MIRRHSLVWLRNPPISPTSLVEAWFEARNPFMVCRTRPGEELSLGFCLPGRSGESPGRYAVHAKRTDIEHIVRPPELSDVCSTLYPRQPAGVNSSVPSSTAPAGCTVRVTGSRMWEYLTGVHYTSEKSDIDLVVDIENHRQLDQAVGFLLQLDALSSWPMDAEISIHGVGEVHWKEWHCGADPVLVKSLEAVALMARQAIAR